MKKEDYRIPAINEINNKFTIVSKDGTISVDLIEVIGRGGSCIAYKAEKKQLEGSKRAVVVKEYYPQEEAALHKIMYKRSAAGEDILLRPKSESDNSECVHELIEKEKKRQEVNVYREINLTQELSYDSKSVQNSAYSFSADYLNTRGDSTYIVIDTTEGCTLRRLLQEYNGKIGIEKAIEYTRELLIVAENMLFKPKNSFCHADIKPENIYLSGMNPKDATALDKVPRIMLLDFGSVFHPGEYKITVQNTEEMISIADKILYNEGIGCSSAGYRSELIQDVFIRKLDYSVERKFEYAKKLVDSINRIDDSVDIFSIVQCFFEMATGELYPVDKKGWTVRKLKKTCSMDNAVAEWMIKMGEKNRLGKYKTTDMVLEDLSVLSSLIKKDAHPQVLLDGISLELEKYIDYEIKEGLFGKISFE